MKVSVSVLKEYDKLISAVENVNKSNADYLHVDVMDGKFVNNVKFPFETVKLVKNISTKPLDVHLMVNDVKTVIQYANLKPEYLTFHVEIIDDVKTIKYLKSLGIKIGLAINPETDINYLKPYMNDVDLVLFMSVNPGFGGQSFNEDVISKIKEFKKISPNNLIISIDGGVNDKTISFCKKAGCNMVVSGSYVTNCDDYNKQIKNLR